MVQIVFPYIFVHWLLFFSHKNSLMLFFSLLKQILTCQIVPKFYQAFATAHSFKEKFWWLKCVSPGKWILQTQSNVFQQWIMNS